VLSTSIWPYTLLLVITSNIILGALDDSQMDIFMLVHNK
jgi:hypothetical protein